MVAGRTIRDLGPTACGLESGAVCRSSRSTAEYYSATPQGRCGVELRYSYSGTPQAGNRRHASRSIPAGNACRAYVRQLAVLTVSDADGWGFEILGTPAGSMHPGGGRPLESGAARQFSGHLNGLRHTPGWVQCALPAFTARGKKAVRHRLEGSGFSYRRTYGLSYCSDKAYSDFQNCVDVKRTGEQPRPGAPHHRHLIETIESFSLGPWPLACPYGLRPVTPLVCAGNPGSGLSSTSVQTGKGRTANDAIIRGEHPPHQN
jgi:hypothetical protein